MQSLHWIPITTVSTPSSLTLVTFSEFFLWNTSVCLLDKDDILVGREPNASSIERFFDFWAAPCTIESVQLAEIDGVSDDGVVFCGVSCDDSAIPGVTAELATSVSGRGPCWDAVSQMVSSLSSVITTPQKWNLCWCLQWRLGINFDHSESFHRPSSVENLSLLILHVPLLLELKIMYELWFWEYLLPYYQCYRYL